MYDEKQLTEFPCKERLTNTFAQLTSSKKLTRLTNNEVIKLKVFRKFFALTLFRESDHEACQGKFRFIGVVALN